MNKGTRERWNSEELRRMTSQVVKDSERNLGLYSCKIHYYFPVTDSSADHNVWCLTPEPCKNLCFDSDVFYFDDRIVLLGLEQEFLFMTP